MSVPTWLWRALTSAAVLVAVLRVAATYRNTAEAIDEPIHVGAALELVDHHTYALDPVHPPLSRLAIGIPLYLAGERFPAVVARQAQEQWPPTYVVGNHILYDDGHYLRNLVLARTAMLPFLVFVSAIVFVWSRRVFGNLAAVLSLFLLTTTPIVLSQASVAYSDLVTAATQCAALLVFTIWLDEPSRRWTLVLGAAVGLACLSKLTSFLFLPA